MMDDMTLPTSLILLYFLAVAGTLPATYFPRQGTGVADLPGYGPSGTMKAGSFLPGYGPSGTTYEGGFFQPSHGSH